MHAVKFQLFSVDSKRDLVRRQMHSLCRKCDRRCRLGLSRIANVHKTYWIAINQPRTMPPARARRFAFGLCNPAEPTAAAAATCTFTVRRSSLHGAAAACGDHPYAACLRSREGRSFGELPSAERQRQQRYVSVGEPIEQDIAPRFLLCRSDYPFLDEKAREASGERWRHVWWRRRPGTGFTRARGGSNGGGGGGRAPIFCGEGVGVCEAQEGRCGCEEASFFLGAVDDDGRVR